jgi:hypothetical protein
MKLHWWEKKAKTWTGDTVHAYPCLNIFVMREQRKRELEDWKQFLRGLAK